MVSTHLAQPKAIVVVTGQGTHSSTMFKLKLKHTDSWFKLGVEQEQIGMGEIKKTHFFFFFLGFCFNLKKQERVGPLTQYVPTKHTQICVHYLSFSERHRQTDRQKERCADRAGYPKITIYFPSSSENLLYDWPITNVDFITIVLPLGFCSLFSVHEVSILFNKATL